MLRRAFAVYYCGVLAERHVSFIGARKARERLAKSKGWDINKISIAELLS